LQGFVEKIITKIVFVCFWFLGFSVGGFGEVGDGGCKAKWASRKPKLYWNDANVFGSLLENSVKTIEGWVTIGGKPAR